MARAGGKNPERLPEAVAHAEQSVLAAALVVKVLALDYGSAREPAWPSRTRPARSRGRVGVVERAATRGGARRLAELVAEEGAERVVVGLPLTLRGERGAQAEETERVRRGAARRDRRPGRARSTSGSRRRSRTGTAASRAPEDARAAAHLLDELPRVGSARA